MTSTERRAHRTAHFTAARNPAACIYFGAFRRMRLTHSAVVSKAYVKKCTIVTYTKQRRLLGKKDTKKSKLQAEYPLDQTNNRAF